MDKSKEEIRNIYRLYIQGKSLKELNITSEFISNKYNAKYISKILFDKAQEILKHKSLYILNFKKEIN
jgi:hypothetical protein